MRTETLETLKEMGFDYEGIRMPSNIREFSLDLTIVKNGTATIIVCHGGQDVYDTLANHGAVRNKVEQKEIAGVPYLTLPTKRLFSIFNSIAKMRILCAGDKSERKSHQRIANDLANKWIAELPQERDAVYSRSVAIDEFEATL